MWKKKTLPEKLESQLRKLSDRIDGLADRVKDTRKDARKEYVGGVEKLRASREPRFLKKSRN